MNQNTILTGIKPTGVPHIGNYLGAIKPALDRAADYKNGMFFIADYHALNSIQNAEKLKQLTLSVAATWIVSGLDTSRFPLYAQSDIPEVFELSTILTNFTPKGWMNKAHAYKAAIDKNSDQENVDAGINMGLYTYPILMAADILIMRTDNVPVGKDQVQHVEIARDIAIRFNSHFGSDILTVPSYTVDENTAVLTGTDGRKMSKSYGNTIPLFATEAEWKKIIFAVPTDSSDRFAPKDPNSNPLHELYSAISSHDESASLHTQLTEGKIGWGEVKAQLLEKFVNTFGPMSADYEKLITSPSEIKQILSDGATTVRPIARDTLAAVRQTLGVSA